MTDSPRQGADTLGLGACTRRSLLKGSGAVAAASALQSQIAAQEKKVAVVSAAGAVPLKLNVNGMERTVQVETRTTLLDVLRYQLDLTGAKTAADVYHDTVEVPVEPTLDEVIERFEYAGDVFARPFLTTRDPVFRAAVADTTR